uniref:Uncharacterized protein n=1 Tax=Picea glauca TaxID=3330 RepID=A0A101M3R3_PICGL|nr:hypothetical protein ABT39_MTgene364 [Picea glauca]
MFTRDTNHTPRVISMPVFAPGIRVLLDGLLSSASRHTPARFE